MTEHVEGCCTNSDGTWSESDECDATCWCHVPVPSNKAELMALRAGEQYEEPEGDDVVGPPKPHCNCRERRGLWEDGKTAPACAIHGTAILPGVHIPEEPYDPRAAGTVYPAAQPKSGVQQYRTVRARVTSGKIMLTVCGTEANPGCGAVVGDKDQHDLFHAKTRSKM